MKSLLLVFIAGLLSSTAFAQFTQQVTLSGMGISPAIAVGPPGHPFTPAGVALLLVMNGSGSCTVEISGDPILSPPPAPIILSNWTSHPILINQTSSNTSNILFPVTAVRLNCGSLSGGTAVLSVVGY